MSLSDKRPSKTMLKPWSSGKHQHALLNLASFHYSTGGMVSAREVGLMILPQKAQLTLGCERSDQSRQSRGR